MRYNKKRSKNVVLFRAAVVRWYCKILHLKTMLATLQSKSEYNHLNSLTIKLTK